MDDFDTDSFGRFSQELANRVQALTGEKLMEELCLQETILSLHESLGRILLENLSRICEVMAEIKCRREFETSLVFDAYHVQVMKNIKLKLDVLRYEFLLTLYDGRTVQDLRGIRDRFEREKISFQRELQGLLDQLDTYSALGPKFREIVVQYSSTLSSLLSVHQDLERFS